MSTTETDISPSTDAAVTIPIQVLAGMCTIVIIEFQGDRTKIARIYDDQLNVIEEFNSCYSGVTRSIVIDGPPQGPQPANYSLVLSGYEYDCGKAPSATPIAIAPYNSANTEPGIATASTYLYSVDGEDPSVSGNNSFGITITNYTLPPHPTQD